MLTVLQFGVSSEEFWLCVLLFQCLLSCNLQDNRVIGPLGQRWTVTEFWQHAERHFFFPELSILFCNFQVCWWILKHRPGAGIIGVSSANLHHWIGMFQFGLTVYCGKSDFYRNSTQQWMKGSSFLFTSLCLFSTASAAALDLFAHELIFENNLLLNVFAVKPISDSPLHELSYFETSEIWMWKLWRRILPSCWWVGMRAVPNFGYLIHSFTYCICSERDSFLSLFIQTDQLNNCNQLYQFYHGFNCSKQLGF